MSDLKEKHPTIHLHIYKAKRGFNGIARGENGKIVNENHKVSLPYDTMEWNNWLKHVIPSGIIKIEVLGVVKVKRDSKGNYESYSYENVPENIKKQVADSLLAKVDISQQTPEQKRIAELEAKIDAILGTGNGVSKEPKKEIAPELEEARKKYHKVFGKKGHHSWDVTTIKEKIETELSKQN